MAIELKFIPDTQWPGWSLIYQDSWRFFIDLQHSAFNFSKIANYWPKCSINSSEVGGSKVPRWNVAKPTLLNICRSISSTSILEQGGTLYLSKDAGNNLSLTLLFDWLALPCYLSRYQLRHGQTVSSSPSCFFLVLLEWFTKQVRDVPNVVVVGLLWVPGSCLIWIMCKLAPGVVIFFSVVLIWIQPWTIQGSCSAMAITLPLDTVRTRMLLDSSKGKPDTFKLMFQIVKEEGLLVFNWFYKRELCVSIADQFQNGVVPWC